MAVERRPSTRAKAPTTSRRAAKPPTAVRTSRVAASANGKRKLNPLVLGGIAGGVVLLGLVIALAVLAGGKKPEKKEEKQEPVASKTKGGPKVDEKRRASGIAKCDQGLKRVRELEPKVERRRSMSPAELDQLRKDLQEADRLLMEGMTEIEESNSKEYVNEYQNAKSSCRKILMELSGK